MKKLKRQIDLEDIVDNKGQNGSKQKQTAFQKKDSSQKETKQGEHPVQDSSEQNSETQQMEPVMKYADGTYRSYDFRRKIVFETTVKNNGFKKLIF